MARLSLGNKLTTLLSGADLPELPIDQKLWHKTKARDLQVGSVFKCEDSLGVMSEKSFKVQSINSDYDFEIIVKTSSGFFQFEDSEIVLTQQGE